MSFIKVVLSFVVPKVWYNKDTKEFGVGLKINLSNFIGGSDGISQKK